MRPNEPDRETGAPRSDRRVERAALAVVLGTVALRVHGAFAIQPMRGFDAPGHLLNAGALYVGELPDPASWSGFHPPLYYAAVAALWHIQPASLPLHVGARLLSLLASLGAGSSVRRAFQGGRRRHLGLSW